LKNRFSGDEANPVVVKVRSCQHQFKLRTGFTFKRIYKQKLQYNEERTKNLRVEYVRLLF